MGIFNTLLSHTHPSHLSWSLSWYVWPSWVWLPWRLHSSLTTQRTLLIHFLIMHHFTTLSIYPTTSLCIQYTHMYHTISTVLIQFTTDQHATNSATLTSRWCRSLTAQPTATSSLTMRATSI